MDWFSWLSKSGLDPSLVYEYGVSLSNNELEEEDIPYFNHEFLQSMGISIAKHRLEILKLAKKDKLVIGGGRRKIGDRVVVAIRRTQRSLAKFIKTWSSRREEGESAAALVVVPRSSMWRKEGMVKRNSNMSKKKMMVSKYKQDRLMLTNGRSYASSSPMMVYGVEKVMDDDEQVYYWSSTPAAAVEEMRWDAMFHNLKPT
ncbi:hypothetical protein LINPERPRIM_LOCUS2318 [Linum perenne]